MTKEKSTVPRLRFPGFTDAWKQRKLGEYFVERLECSAEGELLSVTISDGVRRFSELGRKDNSSEDKTKYKVLKQGDIVYNSMRMWQGASGYSIYDGIVSPAYTVLIPTYLSYALFFSYLFKRSSSLQIFQVNSQGLTSDTWNLKYKPFSNIVFPAPTLPEQEAIGSFFSDLDQLITLHQRKLDDIKELKKALLQKMFPKGNGNDFPELRFPEFTDTWKQRKLGEVLKERNESRSPSADVPLVSFTVENGVTPKTERYNREFLVRDEDKKYKFTQLDDIVYNPANLKFGAIARNKYGAAVFSPIYVTYGVLSEAHPLFVELIVTSTNFIQRALRYQEGTVYERMAVKSFDLLRSEILLPALPEQEAIGSFFSDLDQLITLHQRQLDHLKLLKKALLQQMFI
ncbi:restriction endonuclease subunit S [Streptococcus suis]|nr:restriction endonuclease subunit S [Streptococcus suis]